MSALTEPEPIFEGAVSDRNDRRHRDLKGRGLCPREMLKIFIEEAATLASITLFIGTVAI